MSHHAKHQPSSTSITRMPLQGSKAPREQTTLIISMPSRTRRLVIRTRADLTNGRTEGRGIIRLTRVEASRILAVGVVLPLVTIQTLAVMLQPRSNPAITPCRSAHRETRRNHHKLTSRPLHLSQRNHSSSEALAPHIYRAVCKART